MLRYLALGLKTLVGVGLLGWLVHVAKPSALVDAVRTADLPFVAAGYLLCAVVACIEILKFHVIVPGRIRFKLSASAVWLGFFMNNFMPTNVGGDAYKIVYLRRLDGGIPAVTGAVLLDRVSGLTVLVFLASLVLVWEPSVGLPLIDVLAETNSAGRKGYFWLAIVVVFAVTGMVVWCVAKQEVTRFAKRASGFIREVTERLRTMRPGVVARFYILSITYHVCRAITISVFLHAFLVKIGPSTVLICLAVTAIVSMLPISLGGLGVREGVLIVMLTAYGVPVEAATAVALFLLSVLMLKSVGGGLILIRGKSEYNNPNSKRE